MALIAKRIPHLRKPSYLPTINNLPYQPFLAYWFGEGAGDQCFDSAGRSTAILEGSFIFERVIDPTVGPVIKSPANLHKAGINTGIVPTSGSSDRTVILRFKSTGGAGTLAGLGPNTTGNRWYFRIDTGPVLRIEIQGSGYSTSLAPLVGEWHILACRLKGSTLGDHTIFLDRQSEQASGTATVNTGTSVPLEFLGDPADVGNSVTVGAPGEIDYALWYNEALPDAFISSFVDDPYAWMAPRRRWVPFSGAAGTTFNQAVSGSITSTGALTTALTIVQSLAGSITSTGALTFITSFKQTLTGSISSTGTLARKISTSVEGSITATGSVLKNIIRVLAGSITSTGALASELSSDILKTVAGSITATGALTKRVFRSLSGSISSTGAITKKTSIDLDGSIGMSGDPDKGMAQDTSGSITPTGDLTASAPFVPAPDEGGGPGPDGSLAQRIRRVYGKFKRSSFR